MLVLSRKVGESVQVSTDIEITVLAVEHQRVRLGIRAPRHISIRRSMPEIDVVETNRQAVVQPELDDSASILKRAASAQKKNDK